MLKRLLILIAIAIVCCANANAQRIETSDESIKIETTDESVNGDSDGRFGIAVQVGPGFRIGKVNTGLGARMDSFYRELKKGISYSITASYLTAEYFSVGLRFQNYFAKNSSYVSMSTTSGTYATNLRDKINITFIGPVAGLRWKLGRHALGMNEGVGYLAYKEDVEFMDSAKIRGHNIGLLSEFTYMYNISSKFSFGLSATLLSGSLSSSKITSGGVSEKVKLEQKEGLSNVSFSLALRLDI